MTAMEERRLQDKIVAFVMAGGAGKRLRPLTNDRCKPAVPFGGRYRIVDFVLSNLVNSDIRAIYLLVQYKPQTLIEHIRKGWSISPLLRDQFVTVVPPQMEDGQVWFRGTADAVYQSIDLLRIHRPDMVAVFGADHIYRMDVRQMVRFHHEHEADVTIATLPVPIEKSPSFGIVDVDATQRVCGFEEKPERGKPLSSQPSHTLASMGNYLFRTEVLMQALEEASARGETDFGCEILPRLMRSHRLYAYDFCENKVPGIKPYEEIGYWRDIGTIDAYFEAHRDVLGNAPLFDTFNPQWPIYSSHYQGPIAHVFNSRIDDCLLATAAIVDNASLRHSIVRREAVIEPDVELEECIIMDYVRIGRGSRLRRVIVDRHNAIEPGTVIGYDPAADKRRYYVTPENVVVIPKGIPDYFARNHRGHGLGYDE